MERSFLEWVQLLTEQYWQIFLKGAGIAVALAVIGTAAGSVIGFLTGIVTTIPTGEDAGPVRRTILKAIRAVVSVYVWLFRGTPMMVQAMVIFYGASQLFHMDLNPFAAGMFVVSVNTGAYMAETVRGGIQAIDPGQTEGAQAIGMSHLQTMRLVLIPQVFQNITPQIGNYLISNIKDTSVLSVITVNELFYMARTAAGNYLRYFEVFFIVCIIYLALTTITTVLIRALERRLAGPRDYTLVRNAV